MYSLIFFGSDQYSAVVLDHLLTADNIQLAAIVTDKHIDKSPVEKLAIGHNLLVAYYPDFDHSLITEDTLGLCASFDHLIPKDLIKKFDGRLYNLHPSLLPQYRNVSPVQYAIALGDTETGITLFRISPGIDDGEIISQVSEPILPTDTTPTLTPRLFKLGAQIFLDYIKKQGSVPCINNQKNKVRNLVFTHRLTRDSGYIEWPVLQKLLSNQLISSTDTKNELLSLRLSQGSDLKGRSDPIGILNDLLRALTPWPGIWSTVPTKKGELRISLVPPLSSPFSLLTLKILISGKPNPITYSDFAKYYLNV